MNTKLLTKHGRYIKTIKTPILVTLNKNPEMCEQAEIIIDKLLHERDIKKHLKALKKHDEYTYHHSLNVAALSFFLGFKKCYPIDKLYTLTLGALIHDIGKTTIPLEVLNKPSRLSESEFEIIKTHSDSGYELINDTNIPELSKEILLYHHSRLDGSGYPKKPNNYKISEEVQIVSVSDIFDALTGDRVYKKGMCKLDAYRILYSELNNKLNIDLLDVLIDNISLFDKGDIVQLNTGERCRIVALNTDNINKPIVKVIDEGENEGLILDLSINTSYNLLYPF